MTLFRNYKLEIRNYLVLIFVFFAFSFNFSLAYTETTEGGELLAEVYPKNPGAFTDTSINLTSYEVDLNRSNIRWAINGAKQKEGIGINRLQLTTGGIGKKILVDIEVVSAGGATIKKQISIVPAEVDILWQSDGYVPPFYKGKALVTANNIIKFVALPTFITENGAVLNPTELIYLWSVDSKEIPSGYGKSSVAVSIESPGREISVFVDISNLDNTLKATNFIKIPVGTPRVLFYEINPLSGTVYEKSLLSNFELSEAEVAIKAEPFFFNTKDLDYSWSINSEIVSGNNKDEITVRRPVGISGESLLDIIVASPYQSIKKSIRIKFGQTIFNF